MQRPLALGACVLGAMLLLGAGSQPKDTKPSTQPSGGRPSPFTAAAEHPVTASLVVEHTGILPGGRTRIGVRFVLKEGWHIYAEEPGDAGLPTRVAWSLSDGLRAGDLVWPPHEQFVDPGNIRTFGYDSEVVLWSLLTADTDLEPGGTLPLHAEVEWLACRDVCIPGSAILRGELPVVGEPAPPSGDASRFPRAA